MRTVAILGATGSVGRQALEIVRDHPDLRLAGLAAHAAHAEVVAAAREHGAAVIALADPAAAERARSEFDGRVLGGQDGVVELVRELRADVVLNAIVGAAGLEATMAALEAGGGPALANKESLGAGGAPGAPPRRPHGPPRLPGRHQDRGVQAGPGRA